MILWLIETGTDALLNIMIRILSFKFVDLSKSNIWGNMISVWRRKEIKVCTGIYTACAIEKANSTNDKMEWKINKKYDSYMTVYNQSRSTQYCVATKYSITVEVHTETGGVLYQQIQ